MIASLTTGLTAPLNPNFVPRVSILRLQKYSLTLAIYSMLGLTLLIVGFMLHFISIPPPPKEEKADAPPKKEG